MITKLRRHHHSRRKYIINIIRCIFIAVAGVLPNEVIADKKGDKLIEMADSLYTAQQYK